MFVAESGERARPYSEIRLLRDDANLIVGLYAADEDIRSTDAFELTAGSFAVRLDARGTASDPRVRAGVDLDGTIDHPSDDDEEWVIEASPARRAGPATDRDPAKSRCDVTKAGERRCGAWRARSMSEANRS